MKAVIQRVSQASVIINGVIKSSIGKGLLIFLGIVEEDDVNDIQWLSAKISNLRIFSDFNQLMNLSIKEIGGEVIVVSQFTLHASTKKGNRPSFMKAAKAEHAIPIYEKFINELEKNIGKPVQTGEFGADMKISLMNEGPVTIIIDTKNLE